MFKYIISTVILMLIRSFTYKKCIDCGRKVKEENGLVMLDGFVCCHCLHKSAIDQITEFEEAHYMLPPEEWFEEK